MARSNFGGSDTAGAAIAAPSAFGGLHRSAPGITGGTAWSAASGGTAYADLIHVGGGATTVCTDADGYIIAMQGPDGVNEGMWIDLGTGVRFYLRTTDSMAATAVPVALGTAALGTGLGFSRQGHVHPTTGLALVSAKSYSSRTYSHKTFR